MIEIIISENDDNDGRPLTECYGQMEIFKSFPTMVWASKSANNLRNYGILSPQDMLLGYKNRGCALIRMNTEHQKTPPVVLITVGQEKQNMCFH